MLVPLALIFITPLAEKLAGFGLELLQEHFLDSVGYKVLLEMAWPGLDELVAI